GTSLRRAELAVFLRNGTTPHLAWLVEAQAGAFEDRLIAVDAHTGAVLADFNRVQTAGQLGSGSDLFGRMQTVNVWEAGGVHYMVDTSKPMYDTASNPLDLRPSAGVIAVLDASNQPPTNDPQSVPLLDYATSTTGPHGPWVPDAVSAAVNLSLAYDYFL